MNQHLRRRDLVPTTQAAEGLPRRRWSTAEVERMFALGLFHPEERFELIGGEIVPMAPRGRRHELVRDELAFRLGKLAPEAVRVVAEPQLNLTDDTYCGPDIAVRPVSISMPDVRGATALLVIEVSDSSLEYDLEGKAELYARLGAREYWVIEAWKLVTHVHLEPSPKGYRSVRKHAPSKLLTPTLAPALALRMRDLDL
jgi:Uma2 family endonuclease